MLKLSYSIGTFGREAEYIVALYLRLIGWRVRLSKNSRGPADIVAVLDSNNKQRKWLIQVKSSRRIPRIKGHEIPRLIAAASIAGGDPIVATLHPMIGNDTTQLINLPKNANHNSMLASIDSRFAVTFFYLPSWSMIRPEMFKPV
ncbi:MAG: restriction endonuclease [Nitrososphaeraceae archaeon]